MPFIPDFSTIAQFAVATFIMLYYGLFGVFSTIGLAVNVLWTKAEGGKRAVGFKLSVGMTPPAELSAFKWVRQRSKLAGEIRGSYFVIKGDHPLP